MGVFAREFSGIVAVNFVCWYVYSDRNGTVAFACLRKPTIANVISLMPYLFTPWGSARGMAIFPMPMILYGTEFRKIRNQVCVV